VARYVLCVSSIGNAQLISSQATCLADTDGTYKGCAPRDLVCLCRLDQSEVTDYVSIVQPCIDGNVGPDTCTKGAIYRELPRAYKYDYNILTRQSEYKDLLETVCADDQFGNKVVEFPTTD
jgi:hypothetical protein